MHGGDFFVLTSKSYGSKAVGKFPLFMGRPFVTFTHTMMCQKKSFPVREFYRSVVSQN
jgi:hypothetical protein